MLGKSHFYHEAIKRAVSVFGTMFNEIDIQRDNADGSTTQNVRVPLAYGPKQKFIARLDQQPDLVQDRRVAVTLPRMGFELTGLKYDANRKLNKMQKTVRVRSSDSTVHNFNYSPVPYDISFSLYSFTATAENGLQIVEQILPYFQPDLTVTINAIPELNIKRDVPIVLDEVLYEELRLFTSVNLSPCYPSPIYSPSTIPPSYPRTVWEEAEINVCIPLVVIYLNVDSDTEEELVDLTIDSEEEHDM